MTTKLCVKRPILDQKKEYLFFKVLEIIENEKVMNISLMSYVTNTDRKLCNIKDKVVVFVLYTNWVPGCHCNTQIRQNIFLVLFILFYSQPTCRIFCTYCDYGHTYFCYYTKFKKKQDDIVTMVLSFIILFLQLQFSISLDGSTGQHCTNHNKATHNPICVPNGHTRNKRCRTVKYKQCLTKQYFCQKCTRSSQSLERSSCFDDTYTTMK